MPSQSPPAVPSRSLGVLFALACSTLLAACRDPAPPVVPPTPQSAAGLQLDVRTATVTERGGQATFRVSLVRAPVGTVVLRAESLDATEGRVGSGALSFTPTNWQAPQALVVTGVDDAEVDGDQQFQVSLSVTESPADSGFASLAAERLTLTTVDDETAGVTVGPVRGAATERGGQATFSVVLNAAPASDVTVDVGSSRPEEGRVSPASLRFTRDNWSAPQDVTVTGQDDAVADGPQALDVQLAFRSTALGYATLPARSVSVSNADDDTASIRVSVPSGATGESGTQASFTVVLGSQPTADVTLRPRTGDASEGTLGIEALTFTQANWAAPQTVTVTGVEDAVADGTQPYTVEFAAVQSEDPAYAALTVASVALLNVDNDSAGIRVSAASGDTGEDHTQATFSVVLDSEPTADVTLALASTDTTEGTPGTERLTFTPVNWAAPQTVSVTGVDDALADGRQPYAVRFTAITSADAAYAALALADVALRNTDDDSAGFSVGAVSGPTTEAGGFATFTLALGSEPTADVTVHFDSDDAGEGSVQVKSLTFTAANWATVQEIVVTGVDDLETDGDQPYALRFTPTTSTDAAYAALTPADVSLTNTDDDIAVGLALTAPALATAGDSLDVLVRAVDAGGRTVIGYSGTVHFGSDDAAAVLPADVTFGPADQGARHLAVQLRTAGPQRLDVRDVAQGWTAGTTVEVRAAAASRLVFTQQPADGSVRTALAPVRVAALDAFGNATLQSGTNVSLGLVAGEASLPLQGTTTVQLTNGTAELSGLSVTDEGTALRFVATAPSLEGATSAPFTVVDTLAPEVPFLTGVPASASSVSVTWAAVGDDGSLGTAATHTLRYATSSITSDAEFDAATSVPLPFSPAAAGTTQSFTVTGLTPGVDRYFALRVTDGAGNASRSASAHVKGDPCSNVTCTPTAPTCSADGTTVLTPSSSCQPGTGSCEAGPTATTRCQSYETCSAGACVPVTPGAQAGSVIISEFRSLGSEFIELRNTTGAPVDVAGYTLRNAAGLEASVRALTDPNGTAGTPVLLPAGGSLHGVANPAGAIPGGVGFVYGAPGTAFALTDTGDALALYGAAGNLEDAVDFRAFVSDPNTPLTASSFVGYAGSSTQLEPTVSTAQSNDTATNWCVAFYGPGVRGARVTDSAGANNGSCKVAVINEVMVDEVGADDGKGFVELAGPGGSLIGGAKLTDVEGMGATAGTLNAMGTLTLPAGTRFPADGILLLVDTIGTTTNTAVANFVSGVDVRFQSVDLENSGGDAIQLLSADIPAALLDTVGHGVNGANLVTNTATNGLAMYETGTALYQAPGVAVAVALVRSPASSDTDNNRNDFRMDPTPTPGLPNDAVSFTVGATLSPDDTPAAVSTTAVTVTGTDFGPSMTASFGGSTASTCTVLSTTRATCTAVGAGAPARVSVTFGNGAAIGVPDVVLADSFTYTGNYNETNGVEEADFCGIQYPSSFSVTAGQLSPLIYGRIFEAGLTEAPGQPAGVRAELGYGPSASDPRSSSTWRFFDASFNTQVGNDDEFQGTLLAPATAGNYAFTYRFSTDDGLRWTYCDVNGAGSLTGLTFETAQLGAMTVAP